jgi:hypothetical protein
MKIGLSSRKIKVIKKTTIGAARADGKNYHKFPFFSMENWCAYINQFQLFALLDFFKFG